MRRLEKVRGFRDDEILNVRPPDVGLCSTCSTKNESYDDRRLIRIGLRCCYVGTRLFSSFSYVG